MKFRVFVALRSRDRGRRGRASYVRRTRVTDTNMSDSSPVGSRWRRIVGTVLFDASLAIAALGVARAVFGVVIYLGPGRTLPLGAGGPWSAFILSGVLFLAAASIRTDRRFSGSPKDGALDAGGRSRAVGSLGSGSAELAPPALERTPLPRHRSDG